MKLNVPLIKQKYKLGCSVANMSALYKYFDKDISEDEILKEIGGLTKYGSFFVSHALLALKLGFKVSCYSYNLQFFEPYELNYPRKRLIKRVERLIRKEKRKYYKKMLGDILELLKSRAEVKMAKPSLKTIKNFLDNKLPVAVGVNSAILWNKKYKTAFRTGHYITLIGYKNSTFYFNDSSDKSSGKISADNLLFAISNNVLDSSAYLIVIKK